MINRTNWKKVKEYLEYREHVDQLSEGSLKIEKTYLRYLLHWAGEASFRDVQGIRPTLQEYMLTSRLDGKTGRLSANYIKKTLDTAKRFFEWLLDQRSGYRFSNAWIKTIKPKRIEDPPREEEVVSLSEIIAISNADVENLVERRIRAAAVLWFLSGIRIGAFVSLPLCAVDIEGRTIKQFPSLGVRTKYRKHAVTYLLPIPELMLTVEDWDREVRMVLSDDGYWFAPISPDTREIDPSCNSIGDHRANLARKNLWAWLKKVGLPYRLPHSFRHGHIQYGNKYSSTIEDFKAVSMNVMHKKISTTDEIYSRLKDDDVRRSIQKLNNNSSKNSRTISSDIELFQDFLEWREHKSQ
jgi:site-specific recombinase XerC